MTQTKHQTGISWTHRPGTTGATWNPVTGCTKVSPGCEHCYAETVTKRFGHNGGKFDEIVIHEDRLGQPSKMRGPHTIFVCSMSDLFHRDIPDRFLRRVFDRMLLNPQHTFLVLTKRPHRMAHWWKSVDAPWPSNIWAGTSVESQRLVGRIDALAEIPAPVRFLSAEPLLEPLDLRGHLDSLDWVITGGESGDAHRPFEQEWADEIRMECNELGIAFFHKQNGGRTPTSGGHELFGQEYHDWPTPRYDAR